MHGIPEESAGTPLEDIRTPLEHLGRWMVTAALLFMLAYVAGTVAVLNSGYLDGAGREVDFVAFWSAAKLAVAGNPIAAFDQEALNQAQALPSDFTPQDLSWRYPPGFHLLITPLGLMPYSAAWLLFDLISLTAFAAALWRLAKPVPMGHSLIFSAPIVVITLVLGQVTLLWAAGLVTALSLLAGGRSVLAGLLIGLLSLKPQLGILLPFALAAGGYWRAIGWTVVGAAAVHILPTFLYGIEYWAAWLQAMQNAAAAVTRADNMISAYSFLRLVGLSQTAALFVHWTTAALLAAGLVWLWMRKCTPFDLKAGALCLAIPVATPYAFAYEMVLTVPAVILLVRAGLGAGAIDRTVLALLVFAPASFWFVEAKDSPDALFAPLLLLAFCHALTRAAWPAAAFRHADDRVTGRV